MRSSSKNIKEYLKQIPSERVDSFNKLRNTILQNLPEGFVEEMNYGMIGYIVPLKTYPEGYRNDPKQALPFANIASQKNYIVLYHMGLYSQPNLLEWFISEYTLQSKQRLDMGKSCIRFKNPDQIPYKLIGELMQKISVNEWINIYEEKYNKVSNNY